MYHCKMASYILSLVCGNETTFPAIWITEYGI